MEAVGGGGREPAFSTILGGAPPRATLFVSDAKNAIMVATAISLGTAAGVAMG